MVGGENDRVAKLQQQLDEIWDEFDSDQDGVLNETEGKAFLKAMLQ